MNRLDSMFALDNKVSVYVPATMDIDRAIDNSIYVRMVMERLALLCGGSSSIDIKGGYMSDKGEYVEENTTIVYAYCESIKGVIDEIIEICEMLQREMKQECISLEINNKMYFIDTREETEREVG